MNEDHSPHARFIWYHALPKPKWYKALQPGLTSWCKIGAKETFTLLLFLVPEKKRFYWNDCGKWHKRNVLTVSNDSWFFLKLDVIDCNYKPSINDQLEDVLGGWKEGTNAIKMWDTQLCFIGIPLNVVQGKSLFSQGNNTLQIPNFVIKSNKNSQLQTLIN